MSDPINFQTVLNSLSNPAVKFPTRFLERFSDISPADLNALLKVWPSIPSQRKNSLLKSLEELHDEDTVVSFDDLATALLDDPDPQVRAHALHLLKESVDLRLLPAISRLARSDADTTVRAEATYRLGLFVQQGELEELSEETLHELEEILLQASQDSDAYIRRAALESLGYSSRPEVEKLILAALQHHDSHWIASALLAISHSADHRWVGEVLTHLRSEDALVRLAAVEAAGELGLSAARPILFEMLDDEDDDEVFQAIIWSLSQIGGEDVRAYLEALLDQAETDEEIALVEDALMNLEFTEDMEKFDLLAFDPDEISDDDEENK